ncbi:AAA family ATPase [Clostridioides sp. GD02404]|uniref:AAA family ATPase n=1 Tax=Clostridioides sp. GD02404 TaxID=3054354 RepID=UPI0038AB83A4
MSKKQILYYGPPGTGKTYEAREAALRIINPNIDNELKNLGAETSTENNNTEINLQIANKAFEKFFEYDKVENESKSKFLNDREYKPGKTCYRNMSALNKFMAIMIEKDDISISREQWPDKGSSTFAQYSRAVTNFDLGVEEKLQGNKKGVRLNQEGIRIKEEYKNLINLNEGINLHNLRNLPDFAKDAVLNSIKNTDRHNMSMWKSTIIGALWFIARNGYIFKYSTPKSIQRTEKENKLLKICLGYKAEDNEFLSWVIPYLLDLGLVVESEAQDSRYISEYYLSEEGKDLLRNMKIVTDVTNTEYSLGMVAEEDSIYQTQSEKIYRLNDSFISKRSKLKELFSRYRDNEENNIDMITLHPSFEYENFIEGISVKTIDTGIAYYNKNGVLKDICYKALKNLIKKNLSNQVENQEITEAEKDEVLSIIKNWKTCYEKYRLLESTLSWDYCDNFVLIIDEINRGDMPKVFGETITLLETDKRLGSHNEQVVKLPFTNDTFGIPKNIFILATMNTSDKSIANMDIALRRRFGFVKCNPKLDLIKELYTFVSTENDNRNLLYESVDAIENINKKLSKISFIGPDKMIGHSYLMGKDVFKDENIVDVWTQDIIPLLEEYFLGEYDEIIDVIPERFIERETSNFVYEDSEDILELIKELAIKDEQ